MSVADRIFVFLSRNLRSAFQNARKMAYCLIADKWKSAHPEAFSLTVQLICPIAMEQGLRFAIREGGHTVGAGVVAAIIE